MKRYTFLKVALLASSFCQAQIIDSTLNKVSTEPFSMSVAIPDGNYRVTVTLGNKKKAGQTVVRAESRRHFFDMVETKKGCFTTVSFMVNKHSPRIDDKTTVKLKQREYGYKNWDDSLTLSFCGPMPAVQRISIEPANDVTTVFLCGNSTVVDQESEPWASWGQMITRWFGDKVAVANFAESGLSCTSFLAQLRLDKILSQLKQGDYVIVEFGHNDEKMKKSLVKKKYNPEKREFICKFDGGTVVTGSECMPVPESCSVIVSYLRNLLK